MTFSDPVEIQWRYDTFCLGGLQLLGLLGGVFVLGRRSNNRNNQNTNDLKEAKQRVQSTEPGRCVLSQ